MPLLLLKELPRFDCILQAAQRHPDIDPASTEAFLHLLHTTDLVSGSETQLLSRHHLSPGRFTVLMLLNRHCDEPATPATLADAAGVTRATMTGLLDTLEKDGLIQRSQNASDRRLTMIQLTAEGVELMENTIPLYFRNITRMLAALSQEESAQLVGLLQKLQLHLSNPSA
jgi:DNA-binding MarR family transcriptional regulator